MKNQDGNVSIFFSSKKGNRFRNIFFTIDFYFHIINPPSDTFNQTFEEAVKMKRVLTLILAVTVLLSVAVIGVPSASAVPDGMIIVYIHVPDEWENPHLWAWDDAGNNVFSTWPGGEADADPNNAGWYYHYLPNWANNIIINANDGTIQTDVLQTEGQNVWVTIESPEEVEISFDQLTVGEAPEYVERITVYARVPADWESPSLWAWLDPDGTNVFDTWPGGEMRGSNEEGEWYRFRIPSWANSIIINANAGTVQTDDLTEFGQGRDIWVVVAADLTAEITYENPDHIVPNITVRTQVPADWENPHLWAWSHPDGTNAFSSWPGEPLVRVGDWYEIEVPGWVNSFIVNANGGTIQTGDMSEVEIGRDIWIVVTDAETYEYAYTEIASTVVNEPVEESAEEPAEAPLEIEEAEDEVSSLLWIILLAIGVAVIVVIVVVVAKKRK